METRILRFACFMFERDLDRLNVELMD